MNELDGPPDKSSLSWDDLRHQHSRNILVLAMIRDKPDGKPEMRCAAIELQMEAMAHYLDFLRADQQGQIAHLERSLATMRGRAEREHWTDEGP